jgi:hypothetical protein
MLTSAVFFRVDPKENRCHGEKKNARAAMM